MTLEAELLPRGPYSLALTARLAFDATRLFRDGVLTAVVPTARGHAQVEAWQRPDGAVCVRAPNEEAIERIRFVLALDEDFAPFLRRFSDDPLIGEAVRRMRGLRPIRVATVAHALLRALCGQLIESRRARELERAIVRATMPRAGGSRFRAPPTGAALGAAAPARLRELGLHARRAAALVRICRTLDLERLRELPTDAAAARLERERGLGPWSVGLVCLEGLGRTERGLVGDLGLVKLCSAIAGRRVEAAETAALLEPYSEWAGLAGLYLMAGFSRGLVPLPSGERARRSSALRFRRAA